MGKRHQASRRKAYGRRQHELRERFDRAHPRGDEPVYAESLQAEAYDDSSDRFGAFDLTALAGGLHFALRD